MAEGASLEEIAAGWRANLDANLLSTVLTTTGLLPAIPAGGSIINVSSIGAEYASTSYGAAKAAVAAWTAGLSTQTGPRGVTANAIAPGYIATSYFRGQISDERRAALIEATHDKRAALPDDVVRDRPLPRFHPSPTHHRSDAARQRRRAHDPVDQSRLTVQVMILSGRRTEQFTDADFDAVIPAETDRVRALYADGVVRQIWLRGDLAGAPFIIEAPDADTAHATIESLPMAVSGLSEFTITPLTPYRGFGPG